MELYLILLFVGSDGRVYRLETKSHSRIQYYLERCRNDRCPMMIVLVAGQGIKQRAWYMQSLKSDGTYSTRAW